MNDREREQAMNQLMKATGKSAKEILDILSNLDIDLEHLSIPALGGMPLHTYENMIADAMSDTEEKTRFLKNVHRWLHNTYLSRMKASLDYIQICLQFIELLINMDSKDVPVFCKDFLAECPYFKERIYYTQEESLRLAEILAEYYFHSGGIIGDQ